jgi:DNA excision repair protein ERCC-8
MNQLILDRSTGNLGPYAFARLQTTRLIHDIQHAPRLRFDGGQKEHVEDNEGSQAGPSLGGSHIEEKLWAHKGGVNALAIDRDNRL